MDELKRLVKMITLKSEEDCINMLKEFDNYYYNGEAILTDESYDSVREKIYSLFPNNKYFNTVGAKVIGAKVKHDIPMLSQAKVKTVPELIKWMKKIQKVIDKKVTFLAEPKIDGVSCDIQYTNGKLSRVATRGDGHMGEDKTFIANYIDTIPKEISIKDGIVHIRGELYIPKYSTFVTEKRRNVCSGIINRKDTGLEDLRHIKFVAFQLICNENFQTESDKIQELRDMNFDVVDVYMIVNNVKTITSLYNDYLEKYRDEWDWESDGLVITVNDVEHHSKLDSEWIVSHHHHFNVALKPPSKSAETVLIDIEWNVSRTGNIIPVAIFKEVNIDGRSVSRASLSNYKNVVDMKMEIGDKLLIEIANDVIPYVTENITRKVCQRRRI